MTISYVLNEKLIDNVVDVDNVIDGIASILTTCNDEFVPPLSERYVASGGSETSLC